MHKQYWHNLSVDGLNMVSVKAHARCTHLSRKTRAELCVQRRFMIMIYEWQPIVEKSIRKHWRCLPLWNASVAWPDFVLALRKSLLRLSLAERLLSYLILYVFGVCLRPKTCATPTEFSCPEMHFDIYSKRIIAGASPLTWRKRHVSVRIVCALEASYYMPAFLEPRHRYNYYGALVTLVSS